MYSETLYHGSNRVRGQEIIDNQRMVASQGENHWLGDGSYFFVEDFHAYKWIADMFEDRYEKFRLNYENLIRYYLILSGNVNINKNKVFDLTKTEHKVLFDRVYKEIKGKRQIDDEIAEGIVINYMFNELAYIEDFDIVRAIFTMNKRKYFRIKTRIGYMPQEQICIKNLDVVKDIVEYDFKERLDTFGIIMSDYYFEDNTSGNTSYNNSRGFNHIIRKKKSS